MKELLNLLYETLKKTNGFIEAGFLVFQELRKLVQVLPEKVLDCLDLISKTPEIRDMYVLDNPDFEQTLLALSKLQNDKLRFKSQQIADRLVKAGFSRFRSVLETN